MAHNVQFANQLGRSEMKRTGILLASTLVVCVAYAEPPSLVPFDATPPPATPGEIDAPAELPLEPAPILPNDVRKVREQIKSPLDGSILGKADEKEFRAAYDKLRQASPKAPDSIPYTARETPRFDPYQASGTEPAPTYLPPRPMLPPVMGRNTPASIVLPNGPDDLLTVTLRLDVQAYQLDRLGEYEMADELRTLNQRIRERARAPQKWGPVAPPTTASPARSPATGESPAPAFSGYY
jgi:hypothetical protein